MSDKYSRLLEQLALSDGWVTASDLAEQLGVTTRSVRSYVTAAKAAAQPFPIIAASTSGYKLNREAYAEFSSRSADREKEVTTPRDRVHHLVRRLTEAPEGIDVHTLAESLWVSESTIEADLRKVKLLSEQSGLNLARRGTVVTLVGSEADQRRLLSRLFQAESATGFLELEQVQREFASEGLAEFKTDLIAMLDGQGYFVNEYGINGVLLHVAIAVDRVSRVPEGTASDRASDSLEQIPKALADLIRTHFAVELGSTDLEYLSKLLTTRVVTPGSNETLDEVVNKYLGDDDLELVRRTVAQVREEYLVDLNDEAFMVRLALHVGNLVARAQENSYSRNPLVRSIKTSYPMIYDVAVFIASQIQREKSISINDDEISYIALHLGSHLQREAQREERITCAIVCPNYYDIHAILRERVEASFGADLTVEIVVTRTDVEWGDFSTDIVLTTIGTRVLADNVVVIQPFITEADADAISRAISKARRHRRRTRIKDELLLYFDEGLFVRNAVARSEEEMIRLLGSLMVERGIIEQSYVRGAIEREALSSTAFTDSLAVPHAMAMTASQTAIAIAVNEHSIPWGDNRVNVVALVAFSASGRGSFQTVFDQFVEVFSDRTDVQEIIKHSTDFGMFIEKLVQVIDR